LLYGDSTSARVIAVGVTFAGLLFAVLFYRFFRRVKPINEDEAALFAWLETWGRAVLQFGASYSPGPGEAIHRWVFRWAHRIFRRVAALVRGRRGRDRISIYVLLEYALSSVVLGVSAVVFWALATKCAIAPSSASLTEAVEFASTHFIPGLPRVTLSPTPPLWISIGAGATAWLLFVIVIAPAGSVLPGRQAAHATRLTKTYESFRRTAFKCARFLQWLNTACKRPMINVTPRERAAAPREPEA